MIRNEFLKYQDKLYIIKKRLKEAHNPNVQAWKEWLGADMILRKDGILFFIEEILDLEIMPDETPMLEVNK